MSQDPNSLEELKARVASLEAYVKRLNNIFHGLNTAIEKGKPEGVGWTERKTGASLGATELDTILYSLGPALVDASLNNDPPCPPWCRTKEDGEGETEAPPDDSGEESGA